MPAPYFEQAFWQLTSAELIALGVEHNALDPDPDLPEQTGLSAFGIVAWWERAGVIASAYDFIEVHYNLWLADAEAWLLDSGMETGRAAMLAAGGILVDARDEARNADGLVRCWLNPLGSHDGFIADPFLWWSGQGNPQTAQQRMRIPTGTDIIGAANAAAWMIANRPVGNRGLRLGAFPFGFKTQRPDGTWILGGWDNDFFSKWPQFWLTGDWQEQVATQWRTWLAAYSAAGGTLDYITTDTEWDRTLPKLADVAHEVRCTPGGVAAGRTFTMTLGTGVVQHTATDTNAATVVNMLAALWNASVDANLTPYTAVGVTSGTPYVRITPDNVLLGVSVPTTLTLTATSPGTWDKSTINGAHRPASTQGTTWYADLKAEADAETVKLTPATVEVGDQFSATRGSTTISFTCTAGATEAARVSNVVAGFVAAWNASASADITPIKAHAGADYSTLNSSGVVLLQHTSPAVAFASSISTSTTNGGAANTQTFTKSTATRAFEADYFVDLTDIETHVSFYDQTAWEFAEAQHEVQFEALEYAIEGPVTAVLGAGAADIMEYDSTMKANGWYSSGTPAKRFSAPVGCGRMYGTHQSRSMYHASISGGNTVEAFFPDGVGNIRIARSAWSHMLADVFFLQSMIAASHKPLAVYLCSYTFTNYLTAEQDLVFDMLMCMCSDWVFYWNASNSETVAAEDVVEDAAQLAYTNMEGVRGVPLPMPPRGRWDIAANLNADIVQDFLVNERILTLTIHNDFTWELSERDNVTNVAPVLANISNQTATVGTPFSGVSASATDKNTGDSITYSIPSGPGWLSIHATTGALSGTPDVDGAVTVTVRATDNGSPVLYDETSFLLTVSGGPVPNDPPAIDTIAPQQVAEGSLLSFTVTAEDEHAVTFALINSPPSGAAITSGGDFTWIPSEAQGPGFYTLTVEATDAGSPPLSSTKSFSVTVTEVNTAPVLGAISNQTVNEHELLTVQCSATDADLPAQALTYSLTTAPSGMLIGSTTGTITWTPDETQGSVTPYNVTVRVTDSGSLYHERSFTVTVTETNTPPVLAPIGDKYGAETVLLSFTASATDADVPSQTLTYSLTGSPPSGAAIGSSSGIFTWTPNSSQAGEYDITIRVTDNGSGNLYDEETVHFTILDTNLPPVLAAIGDKSATEDVLLTFTASATDADVGQTITYSLADAPTGATIDGSTGEFEWTPEPGQGGQDYEMTVVATDNGSPPASDSETITITVTAVNHAPILNAIGNKTVVRGAFLGFTVTATDPDGVAVPLAYSADTLPPGASLDSLTGEFAWAPSSAHVGEHSVTFYVTDGELTDSETITITVTDVAPTARPTRPRDNRPAPAAPWWRFKGTGALRNDQ